VILDGPLTVGSDRGGDSPNHPESNPSVGGGEEVEVLEEEGGRASVWALAEACDLMS
jgi:hypothetical protein